MPSDVRDITGTSTLVLRPGTEIKDEELIQCARLFSDNYGVWGSTAPPPLRPGIKTGQSTSFVCL
jgi:hypothetical protein